MPPMTDALAQAKNVHPKETSVVVTIPCADTAKEMAHVAHSWTQIPIPIATTARAPTIVLVCPVLEAVAAMPNHALTHQPAPQRRVAQPHRVAVRGGSAFLASFAFDAM